LTGEIRGAPPSPQWLLDLKEKGALVDVNIAPLPVEGAPPSAMTRAESKADSKVEKGKSKSKEATNLKVQVNGKDVPVKGEKESLTELGREELQSDRVGKMSVLSRCAPFSSQLLKVYEANWTCTGHLRANHPSRKNSASHWSSRTTSSSLTLNPR
jgi:hypothetical protein